ncbi:MAG TPA: hypothetical protein VJB17_03100 [Patescibacteria group bacterium]|nr:hypothetical protein [Patescibacteria group bacterium]
MTNYQRISVFCRAAPQLEQSKNSSIDKLILLAQDGQTAVLELAE